MIADVFQCFVSGSKTDLWPCGHSSCPLGPTSGIDLFVDLKITLIGL